MRKHRIKIWTFSIAFILVTATISCIELIRSYNAIIEVAYTKADLSGYLVSEWIAESFESIEYVLKDSLYGFDETTVYAANVSAEANKRNNQRLVAKASHYRNIIFLGVFDPDCTIQYGSIASIVGDSSKDLKREYCTEVMEEPVEQLKISSFFISSTGEMNVSATYPLLTADKRIAGFALAGLNLSFFQRWLNSIEDPSITISIMDMNRILLARKPLVGSLGKQIEDRQLEQFIRDDAESVLVRVKSPVDTIDRLWALRKIRDLPFVVAVGYTLEETLKPWRTELFTYIIGNLLLATVTLFLAKLYQRNILNAEHLKNLATYDQLTGLMNRRSFEEIVKKKIRDILQYNGRASIAMIDIDHFKSINDTHGHDIGDVILQEISEVLQSSFRSSDIVARWGGEEFIVFLADTDIDTATSLAERLNRNIATKIFHNDIRVTASQGIASVSPDDTYNNVMRKADTMLYKAKHRGRNCVCDA